MSESDLHLSQLALRFGVCVWLCVYLNVPVTFFAFSLAARVLEADAGAAKCVKDKLYPQVLLLVQSSLLQGQVRIVRACAFASVA